jgi:formylglycine-generating enzyme required for sulfatase activity
MSRRNIGGVAAILALVLIAACGSAGSSTESALANQTSISAFTGALSTTGTPFPSRATATATAFPARVTLPSPTGTAASATPTPSSLAPTSLPRTPPSAPQRGDAWQRPADSMVMVYVPGGRFQMGAHEGDPDARSDEFPPHTVTLDGFWIDQTEVTNAQFAAFLNENGNSDEAGRKMIELNRGYCQIKQDAEEYSFGSAGERPVVMVTWYGADAYCNWVGGRLPTEAEWEYAARGPEGSIYPWGDVAPNCDLVRSGDCGRSPTKVGSLPYGASWCGALDMAGNVWEWVGDWFGPYVSQDQTNPTGPSTGSVRVQRGGGWHSPRWELRATFRQHDTAPTSYNG